jgi:hypothetical protein
VYIPIAPPTPTRVISCIITVPAADRLLELFAEPRVVLAGAD